MPVLFLSLLDGAVQGLLNVAVAFYADQLAANMLMPRPSCSCGQRSQQGPAVSLGLRGKRSQLPWTGLGPGRMPSSILQLHLGALEIFHTGPQTGVRGLCSHPRRCA